MKITLFLERLAGVTGVRGSARLGLGAARSLRNQFLAACFLSGAFLLAQPDRAGAQPARIFTVNSAADTDDFNPNSGTMTLRKALRIADETVALDEIIFNIPGTSTIQVNGSFGSLGAVQPVIIDGTTQPGGRVSIDGSAAGAFDPGGREISGFELVGRGSTLKGFSIRGFAFDGVVLRPTGAPFTGSNVVSGNFIHDNKRHGVHIIASQDNLIGGTTDADGNRIEFNGGDGIRIEGQAASGNTVSRNQVGHLLPSLSNGGDCIVIQDAPRTTIGTKGPAARAVTPQAQQNDGNILNGTNSGIRIQGVAAELCRVVDNLISGSALRPFTNGIIHRGGDLLAVEGNTFENIGGIQLDAEFSVGTKYSIKNNAFLANAELAARIKVNGALTVTVDFVDNDIVGSIRGMAIEETAGGGTVDWNIIGTEATGDGKSKEGMSLKFRAGGTKRIVGGPGGLGRGHFSGFVEGNFKFDQTIAPGVRAKLEINGGLYENSGTLATPRPGIDGRVQANAQFPIDILDVVGSGNTADGITLALVPSIGARIDVTATGCRVVGNAGFGIAVRNGSTLFNLVSVEAERDFLDRNTEGNWYLFGVQRSFTIVDNTITGGGGPGITLAGGSDMNITNCLISGNSVGVLIQDTSHGTLSGNAITGNGVGVATEGSAVATLGPNFFSANTGLAIDLGHDGVTPNDPGDTDGRQNFPVLTSAVSTATTTTLRGTFNSTPNNTFTLAFFATRVLPPSGHGDSEIFLGSRSVTTDADGNASFVAALPVPVAAGQFISALATGPAGNTSEFALDIPVAATLSADLALTQSAAPAAAPPGSNITYTIVVRNHGPAAAANVVVSDNLPANTAFVSSTATGGGLSGGTGNHRTVTFAALASGASATVSLIAKISATATAGLRITNTVSVSGRGATDPNLQNNSASAIVTVATVARPLVITGVSATPNSLCPPNHKLVPIRVNYAVHGGTGPVTCTLGVTSNEPVKGTGDGDRAPDWQIIDAHHILLRAERAGRGHGRTYTITITCRDRAGFTAHARTHVTVPKNQGKKGND